MRYDAFFLSSSLVLLTAATAAPDVAAARSLADRGLADGSHTGAEASPEHRDRFAVRLNDLWITALAKARLLQNEEVPGLAVDVDSRDGVVTLFGMVPTLSAQATAGLEVMKMEGVHRVENLLQVVPEPEQEATRAHDRALERVLRERFEAQPETAQADLEVAICNRVARLRGTVESSAEQRAAVEIARNTAGVRQVVDHLQIDAGPAGEHAAAS